MSLPSLHYLRTTIEDVECKSIAVEPSGRNVVVTVEATDGRMWRFTMAEDWKPMKRFKRPG